MVHPYESLLQIHLNNNIIVSVLKQVCIPDT